MKTKPNILTGITPSGRLTIGNYIGSIKQIIDLQKSDANVYLFIANLHAITVPGIIEDKTKKINTDLVDRTESVAALYLACGVDPSKVTIFVQSQLAEHSELSWLLTTISTEGQLKRMTQYKDKAAKVVKNDNKTETSPTGLFVYPILMSADILLYDTNLVPVGKDQKQHVELARDLAIRFNTMFGDTFTIPEPQISASVGKINSLQNPTKKMSKSDDVVDNVIFLLDPKEVIANKIKKAVTATEFSLKYDPINFPGVATLLTIYGGIKNIEPSKVGAALSKLGVTNYGGLKTIVNEEVWKLLEPIQNKYYQILNNKEELLYPVLLEGKIKAGKQAKQKLDLVKKAMGIL